MAALIEILEEILKYVVEVCTIGLELAGITVLVSTAVICFIMWLRRDRENVRLDLAQGIALALEFKMGGEVLRTVVVREKGELIILGAIIILRAALTFLIHWEIESEKKDMEIAAKHRAIYRAMQLKEKEEDISQKEDEDITQAEEDAAGEDLTPELVDEMTEQEYAVLEENFEDNFRRPSLMHKDREDAKPVKKSDKANKGKKKR